MGMFRRKPADPPAPVTIADPGASRPIRAVSLARAKVDIHAGVKLQPNGQPSTTPRVIRKGWELPADDPIVVARFELFDIVGWVMDHQRTYIAGWEPLDGVPLTHGDK